MTFSRKKIFRNMIDKTSDEHIKFLSEFVKLQLWYAKSHSKNRSDTKFIDTINNETLILNFTSLNETYYTNSPILNNKNLWNSILEKIEKIHRVNDNDFEEKCLKILFPYLQQRVLFDLEDFDAISTDQKFRSSSPITFNIDKKNENGYIEFYIENRKYPQSFLDFKEEIMSHLQKIVIDLRSVGVKGIFVKSWLNSIPQWLLFFPEEFKQNEIKESKSYHLDKNNFGFWGQFISWDYTFNADNAIHFKNNLKPLYALTECSCSIDELEKHLQTLVL